MRSHELGLRIAYVEMMIDDAWPTSSDLLHALKHFVHFFLQIMKLSTGHVILQQTIFILTRNLCIVHDSYSYCLMMVMSLR